MSKKILIILATVALTFGLAFVVGCESDAQTGTAIGALAGAGIGQLAGGSTEATLIGAAVGGGAGYALGNEGDKKKASGHKSEAKVAVYDRKIMEVESPVSEKKEPAEQEVESPVTEEKIPVKEKGQLQTKIDQLINELDTVKQKIMEVESPASEEKAPGEQKLEEKSERLPD